VMCDADVYHFGLPVFRKTNKQVRKELKARGYNALTKDWPKRSLRMLENQQFFTPSVRQKLEEGKGENIRWLRKKIAEENGGEEPAKEEKATEPKDVPKAVEKAAAQAAKTEQSLVARGTQTMLRLGSSNHLELSRMADGKANILISVNSIIISVILSVLFRNID